MKSLKLFHCFFFALALLFSACGSSKQENKQPENTEVQAPESQVEDAQDPETKSEVKSDSIRIHDITEKKPTKKTEKKEKKPEPDVPETDVYDEKLDPSPNEFVQVDTEAKPKNLNQIKSEIAAKVKSLGLTGECSVGILVSTHGNYLKHYTFGTTHKKIELAVAESIVNLKFTPAKNKGKPVKMWYKIKFQF